MSGRLTERRVPLPANYGMTVNGPEPAFDYLALVLHADGTVTWVDTREAEERDGE